MSVKLRTTKNAVQRPKGRRVRRRVNSHKMALTPGKYNFGWSYTKIDLKWKKCIRFQLNLYQVIMETAVQRYWYKFVLHVVDILVPLKPTTNSFHKIGYTSLLTLSYWSPIIFLTLSIAYDNQ